MSRLRRFFPRTYIAQRNLQRSQVRTVLAVVTVAVGVVAVGSLGVFGLAFEESQEQTLAGIANEVRVQSPGDTLAAVGEEDPPELTERRMDAVEAVADDATVTQIRELETDPQRGVITSPTAVLGVTNPGATYDVVDGEIPDSWESGVLVNGQTSVVFDIDVGDPIEVQGRLQTVTAIIEEPAGAGSVTETGLSVLVPMDLNRGAETPYRGAVIHAADSFEAERIARELSARLNGDLRADEEEFEVTARQDAIDRIDRQFTSTNTFLLGVGSISLVIAGISIGNLQLVSARERREEIGVLRAVGYTRFDILAIMLIETLVMGVLAAVLGVVATLAAGVLINQELLGSPLAFQPGSVFYLAVAFVFGVVVCVLAGLYPAWRASRERPVEALEG
jgi:putative ABC transport system permease protein